MEECKDILHGSLKEEKKLKRAYFISPPMTYRASRTQFKVELFVFVIHEIVLNKCRHPREGGGVTKEGFLYRLLQLSKATQESLGSPFPLPHRSNLRELALRLSFNKLTQIAV